MFGSDNFPLGPNNQYPRRRFSNFGMSIAPPMNAQDVYANTNLVSKLPSTEKDFHSSVQKTKVRLKSGRVIRSGGAPKVGSFKPRYAPKSNLRGVGDYEQFNDQYRDMDTDATFDSEGNREDEGLVDDSVGRLNRASGRVVNQGMIGSREIMPATRTRPIARSVVGSGGWLKGVQKLLGYPKGEGYYRY